MTKPNELSKGGNLRVGQIALPTSSTSLVVIPHGAPVSQRGRSAIKDGFLAGIRGSNAAVTVVTDPRLPSTAQVAAQQEARRSAREEFDAAHAGTLGNLPLPTAAFTFSRKPGGTGLG